MNWKGIIRAGVPCGLIMLGSHLALHTLEPLEHQGGEGSVAFWLFYAQAVGLLVAYVYAATRPRFGAGASAGVGAGLLVWSLHEFLPAAAAAHQGMAPLDVFHLGWSLVEMAVIGLVARALYREGQGRS